MAFFIIIASSLITIITTAVQLRFDYTQSIDLVDQRFKDIEDAHAGAITGSLWGFDYKLSQIQLNGIASISEIEFAELKTTDNDFILTAGEKKSKNFIVTEIPIIKEKKGGVTELLAKLHLFSSKDEIYSRLIDKAIVILLSNAVKTFIIAGFILLVFQYLVTRHLTRLAQFARKININDQKSLETSFHLDRESKKNEDELEDVVFAMEEMRHKLLDSLKVIQKSEIIVASSSDMIALLDKDYTYLAVNPPYLKSQGKEYDRSYILILSHYRTGHEIYGWGYHACPERSANEWLFYEKL